MINKLDDYNIQLCDARRRYLSISLKHAFCKMDLVELESLLKQSPHVQLAKLIRPMTAHEEGPLVGETGASCYNFQLKILL